MKVAGERVLVNRYVCEIAHGPAPSPEHEAAHECGNPSCFYADCLRWATTVENNADKLKHDTHNRGERHNLAKLTEHEVLQIRELEGSASRNEIADRFGVSYRHVYSIHKRAAWPWLE
ncbi:HNH endonuclease [Allomesorhizobium alhagi]|uniref:Uncharacterized protein n=1 Tax=Mesorhizobium alhagi CCNWXJ12-2 TaxID=1107882 RepID=H0HNG8_9HYPH|nr:HNH endonuclease [Mesorhizobium alhagi]EHK57740.1 hypothetical protein MAXJ12_08454 [Mesorhizobium alhagi CCNWXJ12-2]